MSADPLAEAAADEVRRTCLHPHLKFQRGGNELRCIDCNRYWLPGWVSPTDGTETMMTDFTYQNPAIGEEFRHSPNEVPRRTKKIR